jgi:hypothetical protein
VTIRAREGSSFGHTTKPWARARLLGVWDTVCVRRLLQILEALLGAGYLPTSGPGSSSCGDGGKGTGLSPTMLTPATGPGGELVRAFSTNMAQPPNWTPYVLMTALPRVGKPTSPLTVVFGVIRHSRWRESLVLMAACAPEK